MTLQEIIIEALHDPQNWKDGEVDWNWIDSDLWLHPIAQEHTDEELFDEQNFQPLEIITDEEGERFWEVAECINVDNEEAAPRNVLRDPG